MVWGLGEWADGPLFDLVLKVVFAATAEGMPKEFAEDRGRLYFGDADAIPNFQKDFDVNLAQLRGQLNWMEERLSYGQKFIQGVEPAIPDALCYYLVWFIQDRWPKATEFLSEFSNLQSWFERVREIGHGAPTDMSAEDALDVARQAEPTAHTQVDPRDPMGLRPGDKVSVRHQGFGEDPAVTGVLIGSCPDTMAIGIEDDDLGAIAVHFPKVGFDIEKV